MIMYPNEQPLPQPLAATWTTSPYALPLNAEAVFVSVKIPASLASAGNIRIRPDSNDTASTALSSGCSAGLSQPQTHYLVSSLSGGYFDYYASMASTDWSLLGYWTSDEVIGYNPMITLSNAPSISLEYACPGASGFGLILTAADVYHPQQSPNHISHATSPGAWFTPCDESQTFLVDSPTSDYLQVAFSWLPGNCVPIIPRYYHYIDSDVFSVYNLKDESDGVVGIISCPISATSHSSRWWSADSRQHVYFSGESSLYAIQASLAINSDGIDFDTKFWQGSGHNSLIFIFGAHTFSQSAIQPSDWIAVANGWQKTFVLDFSKQTLYTFNTRGQINGAICAGKQLRINTFGMTGYTSVTIGGRPYKIPSGREVLIQLPGNGCDVAIESYAGTAYAVLETASGSLYSRD